MLVAQVQNDGVLGSTECERFRESTIALPDRSTPKTTNILLAIEDIDFIAHSFVRSTAKLMAVQKILDSTAATSRLSPR